MPTQAAEAPGCLGKSLVLSEPYQPHLDFLGMDHLVRTLDSPNLVFGLQRVTRAGFEPRLCGNSRDFFRNRSTAD